MNYNKLTWHHFETAGCAGTLTDADKGRGAGGSRSQGTWVQFDVAMHFAEDQVLRVRAVKFLALACPHVIAVADWIAHRAVGLPAAPGLPESVASLQERFGVPIEKLGRLLIVEDAWMAAVSPPS